MFDWKLLAVIAPLFFVSYQTLSKFLPKDVPVFLVNAYVSLMGALVMFILHLLFSSNKSLTLNMKYLPLALAIGMLISIGNFVIIKAYSLGAPQSSFTAIYNPLYIVFGIIFGLIIWHEKLNAMQIVGAALSILGILLIVWFKK